MRKENSFISGFDILMTFGENTFAPCMDSEEASYLGQLENSLFYVNIKLVSFLL